MRNLLSSPSGKAAVILLLILLIPGLLLAGAWMLDPWHLHMADNVTIGGVPVGGMNLWEAGSTLKQQLSQTLYSQNLILELPCESLTLDPDAVQVRVPLNKILWQGFLAGRSQDVPDPEISLEPYLTLDETTVLSLLEEYAAKYDTTFSQSQWYLEGSAPELATDRFDPQAQPQTLVITKGIPEAHLDIQGALARIRLSLSQAITACEANSYRCVISVEPSQVPNVPDPEAIYREICSQPVDDSLDLTGYCFVPGAYGYSFHPESAAYLVEAAAPGESVTIAMAFTEPEILGDAVYFRDVLGTCETRHTNNENRNTNLRLLCQALDGYILQPGETFSYNGVVGERTRERGYLPAPAYSGNRLVDSVGGGVCQGSTTLYNCVLLADLEVVFRACHGASVGYVPKGLDAAVNYLTTDFQFCNNFHFPVMIQAEVSDGYVKMKLLGTDEKDYYIEMESGWGEDDIAVYARSYKCKYSKQTGELISRDTEAFSTYYKNIG